MAELRQMERSDYVINFGAVFVVTFLWLAFSPFEDNGCCTMAACCWPIF